MPTNLHTRELILRLKEIRAEKGLTIQEISDKIDERGFHVGINSIKKVFSDGSEDFGFRYRDTLEPIEQVLLDLYDDSDDVEAAAMRADLAVKNELIGRLERNLCEAERSLAEAKEEHGKKLEFLMRQIELNDQRIDRLMTRVDVLLKQVQDLLNKME